MRRLIVAILSIASVASAALTTVTGTINRADGTPASGVVSIAWQSFRNASGALIPAGTIKQIPLVNGVLTVQLEPNTPNVVPAGTSYTIVYNLAGNPTVTMRWFVPASNIPVSIGSVEFPPAGLVGQTAAISPGQLLGTGALAGWCMVWNGAQSLWSSGCGGAGSPPFNAITTGTNTTATMTIGAGGSLTFSSTGIVNANRIVGTPITAVVGSSGSLLETTGGLASGRLLSADVNSNATDSGITASAVVLNSGSYANPSWITSLAASKVSGLLGCPNMPNFSGDVITIAGNCTTAIFRIGGVMPAPSAIIDTTNASNITSGTLPTARLAAINLAASGSGGVTGNLPVGNLNGGVGASSSTVWFGDGTWKPVTAGGTVTNTSGPLVAGNLIIGNSGNDVTILNALGTSTTVLHGNSGGTPSWGPVSLTAEVTGILPAANGGLGTSSIAFSGVSGGVKTFALPNVSSTILTSNAAVTLAQGGTGADLSGVAKGGLIVGTAAATVAVKTVGTDGTVLTADAASTGGMKWAAVVGTGTVTNIATTGPITGGAITTTGTLACPTCVTSAAALTANRLIIGGGSQASAALGSLGTTTTVLHGNSGGAPSYAQVDLANDTTNSIDVDARNPTYSGGVKCDGSTDDAAALAAAIAALPVAGGRVILPSGVCIIGSTITIGDGSGTTQSTRNNVTIQGRGSSVANFSFDGATVIKWSGGASTMLKAQGPVRKTTIRDLVLDGNNTATVIYDQLACQQCVMEHVDLRKVAANGVAHRMNAVEDANGNTSYGTYTDVTVNALSSGATCLSIGPTALTAAGNFNNTFTNYVCTYQNDTSSSNGAILAWSDNNMFIGGEFVPATTPGSGCAIKQVQQSGSGTFLPSEHVFMHTVIGRSVSGTKGVCGNSGQVVGTTFWPYQVLDSSALDLSVKNIRGWLDNGDFFDSSNRMGFQNSLNLYNRTGLAIQHILGFTGSTGSGTISSSGTALTGTGTAFSTELAIGRMIAINSNEFRYVSAIADNTHATIDSAFAFDAPAGSGYFRQTGANGFLFADGALNIGTQDAGELRFWTSGTQRGAFDVNGNLILNAGVYPSNHNVQIRSGAGSPNSAVLGQIGDLWMRTDGGAGTTLYVKESGAGTNTGWIAK